MWALLQLDQTVYAPLGSLLIGSQLNVGTADTGCRIAFYAKVINTIQPEELPSLLIYKPKERTASVDRVINEYELIGWNLLEKGGNIQPVRFDSIFDK